MDTEFDRGYFEGNRDARAVETGSPEENRVALTMLWAEARDMANDYGDGRAAGILTESRKRRLSR